MPNDTQVIIPISVTRAKVSTKCTATGIFGTFMYQYQYNILTLNFNNFVFEAEE